MSRWLLRDIGRLVTLSPAAAKEGRRPGVSDLGELSKAAMIINRDRVEWVGPQSKIPKGLRPKKEVSAGGGTVIPGFVDCHTHLVFAGHRAQEFEDRNQGVSYLEIAQRGGGIHSTVRATRKSSSKELRRLAQARVDHGLAQGITTLEIKSGYGLSLKDEVKCLEVAQSLEGPRIVTTFLGAHAVPSEFSSMADYLRYLQDKVWPLVLKKDLAKRLDIFWEKGFFEGPDSKHYLQAAKAAGFELALHVDQLTDSAGSALGIDLGAQSIDHVIHIHPDQIPRLARSSTVAVLLPTADVYLRIPFPPARRLIDAGARFALASDFNPGSSPAQDFQWLGLLARWEMKMSFHETLVATTVGGALALGLNNVGHLSAGASADFQLLNCELEELFLSPGQKLAANIWCRGRVVNRRNG